jgi:hypothetical protein
MAPNPQNPAEQIPQPVVVAGQPLTTEKVAFTITDISYGEESAKQIQRELEIYASNPANIAGRPPQWNVMGSPDQAKFSQILDARKNMGWDGQSAYFGYARIIQPRNAQRILNTQERNIIETQGAQALNIPLASSKRAAAPVAATTGFATGTPTATPADVASTFVPSAMPAPISTMPTFTQPVATPAPQYAGLISLNKGCPFRVSLVFLLSVLNMTEFFYTKVLLILTVFFLHFDHQYIIIYL